MCILHPKATFQLSQLRRFLFSFGWSNCLMSRGSILLKASWFFTSTSHFQHKLSTNVDESFRRLILKMSINRYKLTSSCVLSFKASILHIYWNCLSFPIDRFCSILLLFLLVCPKIVLSLRKFHKYISILRMKTSIPLSCKHEKSDNYHTLLFITVKILPLHMFFVILKPCSYEARTSWKDFYCLLISF